MKIEGEIYTTIWTLARAKWISRYKALSLLGTMIFEVYGNNKNWGRKIFGYVWKDELITFTFDILNKNDNK